MRPSLRKSIAAAVSVFAVMTMAACGQEAAPGEGEDGATAETVTFGVSGPLTGDQAQYGEDWKEGFELALEKVNAESDTEFKIDFQDSQGQAAQASNIAQKFVSDENILAVMGDFSSATSMVASPVYQRGGVVQLGITNSHPDFTTTGDYIFASPVTQAVEGQLQADGAKALGDKAAVFYLNTDWGITTYEVFEEQAATNGLDIVYSSAVEEASTDFKPLLLNAKNAGADVVYMLTYYKTTALLMQQARDVGLEAEFGAVGSNYSLEYLELAGDAGNDVYMATTFFPASEDPEVQAYVKAFEEKFDHQPNLFNTYAYDGVLTLAKAYEESDGTREGLREALATSEDLPSIVYGTYGFNDERRIDDPTFRWIQVRDGEFVEVDPLVE
ncbi:ABC transporter substrate-binding protein [Tessaracoccus sp. OS52]|uniref:ABC transporter substrate-binding protein n=1 Tax=Tessaracoccus sp. OS52 TaxID=2886691 RepID=UPI001D126FC2|nr:ABC transporter substrate-binding protein [Tessaracoccus sp. OS52]MCC2593897.1 ABC transporter substrate-binding protein [Tessaracoccus sp. OS52]